MGRWLKRMMVMIGLGLGALWLALGLTLFFGQRSLIFPHVAGRLSPEGAGMEGVRIETLTSADGTPIELWRIDGDRSDAPVVLLFHGNGETNAANGPRYAVAGAAGYAVAAMEYRGYNGTAGSPSEAALVADATAVLAHLQENGIDPDRIVLWGYSIGTGIAVAMAARHPVAGIVLEAPFLSLASVAASRYPLFPASILVRDPFRSDRSAPDITAPALILSGGLDSLIPPGQGQRLAALIPKSQFVAVPEAGHADLLTHLAARRSLADFLKTVSPR